MVRASCRMRGAATSSAVVPHVLITSLVSYTKSDDSESTYASTAGACRSETISHFAADRNESRSARASPRRPAAARRRERRRAAWGWLQKNGTHRAGLRGRGRSPAPGASQRPRTRPRRWAGRPKPQRGLDCRPFFNALIRSYSRKSCQELLFSKLCARRAAASAHGASAAAAAAAGAAPFRRTPWRTC